ncbi:GNAT family N-acetyltransferase [Krasilnikovia sp. MM14-A1004]|uniref:GNAT family N-acetyltransferase n=1 Tax=Krasilnikovia sp. MM14-A1004 TaxID=3373541 RepID=UPI00399C6B5C
MEIIDRFGLSVALVAPEAVADAPWRLAERPIDVVRVADPPADLRPVLTGAGFVVKPTMLTWVAPLEPTEEEFLLRLDTKARQDVRRAQRRAGDAGLRLRVEQPVTGATFDRFLALYEERVAEMPHGVAFANRHRDAVLGSDQYFAVLLEDGGDLAGGTIVLESPDVDGVRMRFSAVTESWRRFSLARVLYFAAMRTAREKGYSFATLGDEPNLYGHLTQPGLFSFKVGSGFAAVASQDFGDPLGDDLADLVLRLTTLSDPSLILGYADAVGPERRLHGHLVATGAIDPRPYAAPFLTGLTLHTPGGPPVAGRPTTLTE